MMQTEDSPWPNWYFYVLMTVELITMLTSAAVIWRVHHKRAAGGRAAEAGMLRFIDDLVLCLCTYYIVEAFIQGPLLISAFLLPSSHGYAKIRPYWWTISVPLFWFPQVFHTYIAAVCYNWLVRGHGINRLRNSLRPTLKIMAVSIFIQFFFEVIVIFMHRWTPFLTPRRWALVASYEHLVIFVLNTGLMCFFYLATCFTLLQRFHSRERVKKRFQKIVRRFLLINGIAIFCFACWAAFLFNLYQDRIIPHPIGISLLLVVSIQPIFDAIILGNLLQGVIGDLHRYLRSLQRKPAHHLQDTAAGTIVNDSALAFTRQESRNQSSVKRFNSLVSSFAAGGAGILGGFPPHLESPPALLFVTTFNMGPIKNLAELGGRLEEWVPASGYDLYVIGLQECHCVEEVRAALHEHVGGAAAYHMFAAEVGASTILFGSIALTVFARTAEVASGAFAAVGAETSRVRNGVNFVITKASNKGMAGLSFRYHDATLAFVTCHYASDSGGKKRLRRRNEDARRTLREIKLTDDEGFDIHLQHHHTFVLGDLNYRMRLPARGVVKRVAKTARRMEESIWQDEEMATLEAAAEAAAAAAAEAATEATAGKLILSDDGEEEEIDEEKGGRMCTEVLPASEGEQDEGPNWVSKAYMKLFTEAGEGKAVMSFLSQVSSYTGGNGISSPSRKSTVLRDGPADTETDDDTGEEQSIGISNVNGYQEGRPLQWVELTENGSTTTSSSAKAGTNMTDGVLSPGLALQRWFHGCFRTLFHPSLYKDRSSTHTSSDAFSSLSSSNDTFSIYSLTTPATSLAWDWVARYDELILEMKAGQVFAGFVEGVLTFPPPFRWQRGGKADNFTEDEQVANAYVLMKKGDGERVPSYTDRVLFHSLPDVRRNLRLVGYYMCDHVRGSDHRPVSAAFHLTVDRARIGFRIHSQEDDSIVSPNRPIEYSAACTWGVQIFDAVYKPYRFRPLLALEPQAKDAASSLPPMFSPLSLLSSLTSRSNVMALPAIGAQSHWKVTLYFPCVLEDPWAADAKVRDIELALLAADDQQSEHAHQARELKGMQRCHETTWPRLASSDGLVFDAMVLPAVSRHALIRLTDGQTNTEVGQGVICLRQAAFTNLPEGGGLRPSRQWVHTLLHRRSNREVHQGVEVLISNQGKAVGLLCLQIKIRWHRK